MSYDEGVVFVKKRHILFEVGHEIVLDLVVGMLLMEDGEARKYPFCIGVYHKGRVIPGIEENGVGCFGADSLYFQQSVANFFQIESKHPVEIAVKAVEEEVDK